MGLILHIIVVGFHHAHGPIVEYAFPPFPGQSAQNTLQRLEVPEEWSLLPFLALPDGSHQSDEDFTYFHLPPIKNRKDAASKSTLFGISCNRQILTKDLVVKTDDVTRSSVQKAVVVLARQPIFGVLRQRLAVVTAAWFGQKDFTQTDILAQFYDSLDATVSENIPDSAFMMGTSLGELVKKFKYKVLVLLKLLLLEKRVIFFGYPVETLCTYQYSLISLIPGLLKSLQDTGSPLLDSQEVYMQSMSKTPAQSTDKQALFKYLGLPLHIFGEQIDILQDPFTRSYIIGTTNAIFLHNRDCSTDVIVNTEPGTIEFLQDSLSSVLSLTSADRRWMDEIIEAVNDSGDNDRQTEYTGSDDYLRAKFEEYILTLLSSVKHSQFTQADDSIENIGNLNDRNLIADYGTYFVKAWQETPNYQLWNDFVDWELLNEIVAPGHPCQGNFSLAHVQRRLANQLKDIRIDKNLEPLKQSFSRALTTSRARLSNVFDSVWQEFEKLQPEEDTGVTSATTATIAPQALEPAIYTPCTRNTPANNGKGLIQSVSTKPVAQIASRSVPDPELMPEDDEHDRIIPQSSYRSSPRAIPSMKQQQQQQQQQLSNSSPRSRSASGSPAPAAFNSLGPATAATAALGQKAAGMFSNVSSFFQAKKKELLDTQREAEEQYQQRIHQHERKQRLMQERAKATASTFAIPPRLSPSPKPNSKAPVLNSAKNHSSSTSSTPSPMTTGEVFAYVAPKSPPSRKSPTSPRSIRTVAATAAGEEILGPSSFPSVTKDISTAPAPASEPIQVPIISPKPTVPNVTSPTLTRGGSSADRLLSSLRDQSQDQVEDLDQESLQELEKELQEALESNDIPLAASAATASVTSIPEDFASSAATTLTTSRLLGVQEGSTSIAITPTRSVTPVEAYSPFSEISPPTSPAKETNDPLANINASMMGVVDNNNKEKEEEEEEEKEKEDVVKKDPSLGVS
ncbi:late secretory pathway protein avl9 [Lobosporangium transversale]|nr:late secretory pathway protein avl9 [Lobosporangium transversale]